MVCAEGGFRKNDGLTTGDLCGTLLAMSKPEVKKRLKGKECGLTSKKIRRERGWNGFAESDTADFASYLALVIPEGLKRIRAFPGHPVHVTKEEWWEILDDIIEGFLGFEEIFNGWPNPKRRLELEMQFRRATLLFGRHFPDFWT